VISPIRRSRPHDLEVEDPEATAEKQQRVKASVPAVFS
jgi:hypothetical protein